MLLLSSAAVVVVVVTVVVPLLIGVDASILTGGADCNVCDVVCNDDDDNDEGVSLYCCWYLFAAVVINVENKLYGLIIYPPVPLSIACGCSAGLFVCSADKL